jgi:hypothetical protein
MSILHPLNTLAVRQTQSAGGYAKHFWRSAKYYHVVEMATTVIERTESMDDLLDWFAEQPCTCATVGHIAHEINWSRETVRNNLKQLMAGEYAERRYKPTGEYRLIRDPRDDD